VELQDFLTPGLVLATGVFLWREIGHLSYDIDQRLEGYL